MTATRSFALTATERVIDRVHGDAADVRTLTHPAAAPGFANRYVLVIEIANLTDGRVALDVDLANLARRHLHRRVFAFFRHELHGRSGTACDLSTLADLQLHVVDLGAERNILQRQRVTGQDVDVRPGDNRVADLQAEWLQDVPLLAVRVGGKRDPSRAVRVVFDRRPLGRNVPLVALEIDDAVHPFVAAARHHDVSSPRLLR